MAFDTINAKIYFKYTDSWYRFDIYHLKNEIGNAYLGPLADITCNSLDSFEKIELHKNYAYGCEKNVCYYPKNLALNEKFGIILNNSELRKKIFKRFS